MQDKQASFDFDEPPPARPREPPVKAVVKRESSSICAWCGARMAASLMDRTPALTDEAAWKGLTVYHASGCAWITSKGRRQE